MQNHHKYPPSNVKCLTRVSNCWYIIKCCQSDGLHGNQVGTRWTNRFPNDWRKQSVFLESKTTGISFAFDTPHPSTEITKTDPCLYKMTHKLGVQLGELQWYVIFKVAGVLCLYRWGRLADGIGNKTFFNLPDRSSNSFGNFSNEQRGFFTPALVNFCVHIDSYHSRCVCHGAIYGFALINTWSLKWRVHFRPS